MQTDRSAPPLTRLDAAVWALLVTQLVHGVTPADTSSEGWFGAVVGLILLVATAVAIVGLRAGSAWAPRLAGLTGSVVALGFVAYHATPFHSPVTNPYVGEPVGAPAWISVALAVAAGAWTAYESRFAASTPATEGVSPGAPERSPFGTQRARCRRRSGDGKARRPTRTAAAATATHRASPVMADLAEFCGDELLVHPPDAAGRHPGDESD